MNYKPFPDSYWVHIKQIIMQLKDQLKADPTPLYAAFDADGTLWDMDLGENFFNYQIDQQCVDLPNYPWNYYQELKKQNNDPRSAYLWLAQINKNQPIEQVRKWSQLAYEQAHPVPLFSEQKKLIQLFMENDIQVFIVTASVKWAVEPGAKALGLTEQNVIGVETNVTNNLVTDIPIYPVTYKEGKVAALMKKTNNVRPFFASGNSTGDLELLESATHLRLAVSAASRDDRLFQTEHELMQVAGSKGWMSHRFV